MYRIALPEQLPREEKRRRRPLSDIGAGNDASAEPESAADRNPGAGETSETVILQLQVNELQKRLETELERHLCKICYEREIDTVILDCNHRAVCARCLDQVSACPLCRVPITKIVQTYNA